MKGCLPLVWRGGGRWLTGQLQGAGVLRPAARVITGRVKCWRSADQVWRWVSTGEPPMAARTAA